MKLEDVLKLRHPCVYMIGKNKSGVQICLKSLLHSWNGFEMKLLPYCAFSATQAKEDCHIFCQTPANLNKRFWRKFKDTPMGMLKGWVICTFAEAKQGYRGKEKR